MELNDFIAKAMSEIIDGVDKMHQQIDSTKEIKVMRLGYSGIEEYDRVEVVEFEVSVGIESGEKGNVDAKINVIGLINTGGSVELNSKETQLNKIKFSIPVYFTRS